MLMPRLLDEGEVDSLFCTMLDALATHSPANLGAVDDAEDVVNVNDDFASTAIAKSVERVKRMLTCIV